jgi:hypothetical protein
MYADIYAQSALMGIDVIGESQLVGYKSQVPSVTMIDYKTSEPNSRYWVLKLLLDNFGPEDKLVETNGMNASFSAQAFSTSHGKKLLVVNKRNREQSISMLAEASGATVTFVAPSTGDGKPLSSALSGNTLVLEPFEVAVVNYK